MRFKRFYGISKEKLKEVCNTFLMFLNELYIEEIQEDFAVDVKDTGVHYLFLKGTSNYISLGLGHTPHQVLTNIFRER